MDYPPQNYCSVTLKTREADPSWFNSNGDLNIAFVKEMIRRHNLNTDFVKEKMAATGEEEKMAAIGEKEKSAATVKKEKAAATGAKK